jgi:cyclopropane fatty-acyl-phospholipid synthase-like methyltransferase
VVDAFIEALGVGPRDVVYDLGCADARTLVAVAQRTGARCVGLDINETARCFWL